MGFFSNLLGTNVAEQAEESAETVMGATREGMDISAGRYGEVSEQLSPYLMGGETAYSQMLAQMGLGGEAIDPTQTAMFQKPFDFAQGRIKETMSSGGEGLYSGSTMQALQEQAMSQYYQQYMPMLMGMSQQGQQGAFQFGGMGMNEAMGRANMLMGGTETAEGLKVQGEAAKSAALGGLMGSVMGLGGQVIGGGAFKKAPTTPSPSGYTAGSAYGTGFGTVPM